MSTTFVKRWNCPRCGKNNDRHAIICSQCDHYLSLSDSVAPGDGAEDEMAPIHREGNIVDRFPGQNPETAKELLRNADVRLRNGSLVAAGMAAVSWVYLAWEYHKWDAQWGPLNVLLVAVVIAAIVGWWISRRSWYRDQSNTMRWRLIVIPAAGFILCASGGIYFTEPIEAGGSLTRSNKGAGSALLASAANRRSPNYRYDYNRSRASETYLLSSILDLGSGVDDVDVDEGCFIVLLLMLVIALILGSVIIPHFWILATFVLLIIMSMVASRELRRTKWAWAEGTPRP